MSEHDSALSNFGLSEKLTHRIVFPLNTHLDTLTNTHWHTHRQQQQALNWAVYPRLSGVLSARDGLLPAGEGPISTQLSLCNTQLALSLAALVPNILSLTSHCQATSLLALSLYHCLGLLPWQSSENNIIHTLQIIRAWDILLLCSSILHQANFTTHQLKTHFPVELSSLSVNFFFYLCNESMIMKMSKK